LMGLVGSSFFTVTEAWISILAGDEGRGRVIGLYAVALSAGFGLGPLLLSATGFAGWTPFIAGALLIMVAALPLLFTHGLPMGFGDGARISFAAVFARAPLIVLAVAVFGLYEAAALALLPIWGVRLGFDPRLSVTILTAIYLGSIALQLPIGWLSDHVARLTVLRLCGAAGLLGAALLPFVAGSPVALFAVLLLWGGMASGLYPVALSMAGDRFRGAEMVTANVALVMSYGVGALVGPILGGSAIDLWNPHGLLAVFVLVFALFLAATFLPERGGANPARSP
jgi:MFS family permease